MKYPDGRSAIKTKLYKLKEKINSEKVKKGKSLIYIDGIGTPQKWS